VKCEVGALLSSQQASTLAAQLAEAQAAVERLTGQWQAAEAARQELIRAAGRRAEQVAAHAVERMHMQVRADALRRSACA
jgi:predicted transcriptional regulator